MRSWSAAPDPCSREASWGYSPASQGRRRGERKPLIDLRTSSAASSSDVSESSRTGGVGLKTKNAPTASRVASPRERRAHVHCSVTESKNRNDFWDPNTMVPANPAMSMICFRSHRFLLLLPVPAHGGPAGRTGVMAWRRYEMPREYRAPIPRSHRPALKRLCPDLRWRDPIPEPQPRAGRRRRLVIRGVPRKVGDGEVNLGRDLAARSRNAASRHDIRTLLTYPIAPVHFPKWLLRKSEYADSAVIVDRLSKLRWRSRALKQLGRQLRSSIRRRVPLDVVPQPAQSRMEQAFRVHLADSLLSKIVVTFSQPR